MNPFTIIKYQLYLLQLENYQLLRYWKLLFKKGLWLQGQQRKDLVWTNKAKGLMVMAVGLHILAGVSLFFAILAAGRIYSYLIAVVVWVGLAWGYFIFFSVALCLLWPVDWLVKQIIIARAKAKIKHLESSVKVIGIAGSYGKTTMKEVLAAVLSSKYKVTSTPESVNTPVGIARWILKNFSDGNGLVAPHPVRRLAGHPLPKGEDNIEIAIIEMGEHYQGDINELCKITPPDIAVVAGINEAHLERMKTLDTVIATIFEIVSSAKPGATVYLNADDQNVMVNYKKFVWPDNIIKRFKIEDLKNRNFDSEKLLWTGEVDGVGKVEVNLLGEYALADVSAAVQIAGQLGMAPHEIQQGIGRIQPIGHRLQPIKSPGEVLIIDDAYNGNPAGVREAIKVLAKFNNRRKLFITPGLVESGKATAEVHREIGKQLAAIADVVILIRNSVTPFIEEGLSRDKRQETRDKPEIVWFNTAQEAHANLKNILQPGDVILFQNDWGDQYI